MRTNPEGQMFLTCINVLSIICTQNKNLAFLVKNKTKKPLKGRIINNTVDVQQKLLQILSA